MWSSRVYTQEQQRYWDKDHLVTNLVEAQQLPMGHAQKKRSPHIVSNKDSVDMNQGHMILRKTQSFDTYMGKGNDIDPSIIGKTYAQITFGKDTVLMEPVCEEINEDIVRMGGSNHLQIMEKCHKQRVDSMLCLIGRFYGIVSSLDHIMEMIKKEWGDKVRISPLSKGFFQFSFDSKEKMDNIIKN